MILQLIEGIAAMGAAAYVCSKIENDLIAAKLMRHPLEDEMGRVPPPRPPQAPAPAFDWYAEAIRIQKQENARLLALCPDAFWLDPSWWGDEPAKPTSEEIDRMVCNAGSVFDYMNDQVPPRVLEMPTYDHKAPHCPIGCDSSAKIMSTAGDENTSWECSVCSLTYTKAGAKRAAKDRAKRIRDRVNLRHQVNDVERGRQTAEEAWESALPCGCTGEVTTRSYPSAGWDMGRYALCLTCEGTWDYAKRHNYEGANPRKAIAGSKVEWPNGKKQTADEAWEQRAIEIHLGQATNHGSCPRCSHPVDKRDGPYYYCSNKRCEKSREHWK